MTSLHGLPLACHELHARGGKSLSFRDVVAKVRGHFAANMRHGALDRAELTGIAQTRLDVLGFFVQEPRERVNLAVYRHRDMRASIAFGEEQSSLFERKASRIAQLRVDRALR